MTLLMFPIIPACPLKIFLKILYTLIIIDNNNNEKNNKPIYALGTYYC